MACVVVKTSNNIRKPRVVLPSTSKKCIKCLQQVQRGYFSLFNQSTYCFVAFPLSLPSSLLKLHIIMLVRYQIKADRLQMIVVAKKLSVLQLFISRMPKVCAILQLVSAPLTLPPILKIPIIPN